MDRERSVAIHEAGHVVVARACDIPVKRAEIWRTKQNDTKGEVITVWPELPEDFKTNKESHDEIIGTACLYFSWYSAGYMAEWMYSGKDYFWTYRKKSDLEASKDWQKMQGCCRILYPMFASRMLQSVTRSLSKPERWGRINHIADVLIKDKLITDFRSPMSKDVEPIEPEHDPGPLVAYFLGELYQDEF